MSKLLFVLSIISFSSVSFARRVEGPLERTGSILPQKVRTIPVNLIGGEEIRIHVVADSKTAMVCALKDEGGESLSIDLALENRCDLSATPTTTGRYTLHIGNSTYDENIHFRAWSN